MKIYISLLLSVLIVGQAYAQCDQNEIFQNDSTNAVCFDTIGKVINVYSNNFPDHPWGNWPSNTPVTAQDFEYHFCAYPQKADQPTSMYNATGVDRCSPYVQFGIGVNGIFFAGWGARWFVNPNTMEENTDWNVEPTAAFNMDYNNAHSNNPGEFHYHGTPTIYFQDSLKIDGSSHSPLVGFAADGFPVYYKYVYEDPTDASGGIKGYESGYALKDGNRPGDGITEPNGAYDGYYVEDYEYSPTELDECNGRFGITPEYPNGTYYYVLTDNWPYMPRCFYGTHIDNSFRIGPMCPESTAEEDCSERVVNGLSDLEIQSIAIYPNPTADILNLQIGPNTSRDVELILYDINGKVWLASPSFLNSIDVSEFPSGTYFLQLSSGYKTITRKVIVSK